MRQAARHTRTGIRGLSARPWGIQGASPGRGARLRGEPARGAPSGNVDIHVAEHVEMPARGDTEARHRCVAPTRGRAHAQWVCCGSVRLRGGAGARSRRTWRRASGVETRGGGPLQARGGARLQMSRHATRPLRMIEERRRSAQCEPGCPQLVRSQRVDLWARRAQGETSAQSITRIFELARHRAHVKRRPRYLCSARNGV